MQATTVMKTRMVRTIPMMKPIFPKIEPSFALPVSGYMEAYCLAHRDSTEDDAQEGCVVEAVERKSQNTENEIGSSKRSLLRIAHGSHRLCIDRLLVLGLLIRIRLGILRLLVLRIGLLILGLLHGSAAVGAIAYAVRYFAAALITEHSEFLL